MKNAVVTKAAITCLFLFMLVCGYKEQIFAAELINEGDVTDFHGEPSGTLHYYIYDDGIMVITGKGPGASYRPFGMDYGDKCPWDAYRQQIRDVFFYCEIEGTTTPSIGNGGSINGWFTDCTALELVHNIPEGITDMSAAFYNCINLSCVENIPSTVKTLQYTFWNCKELMESPVLPQALVDDLITEFEGYDVQISQGLLGTFHGCESLLVAPVIPDNPNLYKMVNTFEGCTELRIVKEIPVNITYYQASFKQCHNLSDVMYIRAPEVVMTDGVFEGAAANNLYLFFVKTDYDSVSLAVRRALNESSRVYPWNGEFNIHFMVLNSIDSVPYNAPKRTVNLRYGCDYANDVVETCRQYIMDSYGQYYNQEYESLGNFPIPYAQGFVFEGWYLDAAFTQPLSYQELVNPSNRQLAAGELILYAKMTYNSSGCVLTINPNGGIYDGNSGITTVNTFENKSFMKEFTYTGASQQYTVPITGNYDIQLYGAQGGGHGTRVGGYGAMMSLTGNFAGGAQLYFHVGGGGQTSNHEYSAGGYNGGGDSIKGYLFTEYDDDLEDYVEVYDCCGGGGGATDVRLFVDDVTARIGIAGGGGGAGRHNYWYCGSDNPELPNTYYDDDGEEYYVYERTIQGAVGQGGNSAAGGGGGAFGGAHNYANERRYGKANSSYGGMNGYNQDILVCLSSAYHVRGSDTIGDYGENGYALLTYNGMGYIPSEPVREGYRFAGWTVEGDGVMLEDTVFMSSGSTVLTALWIPVDYKITFEPMGGSISIPWMRFWFGMPYGYFGDFPIPQKEGEEFLGWYTGIDGGELITEGMLADKTESITLYARYESEQYTVYLDPADGFVNPEFMSVQAGKPYGVLPTPIKSGHKFVHWENESGVVNSGTIVTLLKDHTLTAVWQSSDPPEISIESGDGEWRNAPLPVNMTITASGNALIKSVKIMMTDSSGIQKMVVNESYVNPISKNYRWETIIGDIETKLYEGITEWEVLVEDTAGNAIGTSFIVKLDYTPPLIGNFTDMEGIENIENMDEKEYQNESLIIKNAYDNLSGVYRFYLTPASKQGMLEDDLLTALVEKEPFTIMYETDREELRNEAGYVLTAVDRAGNVTRKLMFTHVSISNTVIPTVPRDNYD